ncbi:erythrocyte band 7 integral membrane protein [Lichtheimia corymbifera JMRC:FSU:9682]|uniref:Erythrocyte band 7 integral membrane protein n=1 Tax=Lichtheimia corymbifera JMRC:FSU:9682 TaxID=1263082 RepID=A0A068RIK4_9FUNG|nr:erythrocyte band 7 integral membrane protein [Lichtheimia corymbifera JMRC:FSU:9682]
MQAYTESSGSAALKQHPPYTDDDDDVPGIKKHDVETAFAQNYGLNDIHHGTYGTLMTALGNVIGLMGSIPCCICCPNPFKRVHQGTVGLVSRFGKCYRIVDPGLVQVNPVTESLKRVDVTIQITDVPKQEIMTKDNCSIKLKSVLYWRVVAPYEAEFGVANVSMALIERARTALRNVCGQHSLQDLIENRDAVSREIQKAINPAALNWGVEIEATLVKDIDISEELQESLSSAAQAKRIGESRVITSEAEVESAKLMREAADILSTPAAMQIRYLETLSTMSRAGHGPKTIFMPLNHNRIDNDIT